MISVSVTNKSTVKAKELRLNCKVVDGFTASLYDENGNKICTQEDGYVPSFMPGEHFGDYIKLNIDLGTGQITNWVKPTIEAVQDFVDAHSQDN